MQYPVAQTGPRAFLLYGDGKRGAKAACAAIFAHRANPAASGENWYLSKLLQTMII